MALNIKLRPLLHRKIWESVVPCIAASAAGGFVVADKHDLTNGARLFSVQGSSAIYLYQGENDGWAQLPNSGIAGTFAAGSCGEYRALGAMGGVFTQTASAGGTTTTIPTNRTITRCLGGSRIRVVAGTGAGYDGTVLCNTLGANAIITVAVANGVAFDATTQFQVYSGSLWFFNAGTTAVGFSVYDVATNAWTSRSVTGLPTAWGTCGQLVSTIGAVANFATGTATAGASTTLTNSGKAWSTNMWANYQIRITGGTGNGQIRTVASNTGTVITVSAAWTVTPDATSTYAIEGNGDYFYLMGNNAVTMYRFSVSGNTWTTLSPVAARSGALAAGGSADWIDGVTEWAGNETQVAHYTTLLYRQNGRYIYSFRGGATNTLDVYDIAANTWISGVAYGNQNETFTAGSSSTDIDGHIYITKEATGRLYDFVVARNKLEPYSINPMQAALGGTAVEGDKLAILPYTDGGTDVHFLYMLRHSGADINRVLMF
ncbi:MAG: hypothetical protein L6R48_10875 [Planctomycetes bacterium]|nr:hypothetical protein [Planctomycetota bacterium]